MIIPIYGFVEGDTIGMLMLARPEETVGALGERLQQSAALRVSPKKSFRMIYGGEPLDLEATVRAAGLEPLERIDLISAGDAT
jgi:hypothetical protein